MRRLHCSGLQYSISPDQMLSKIAPRRGSCGRLGIHMKFAATTAGWLAVREIRDAGRKTSCS